MTEESANNRKNLAAVALLLAALLTALVVLLPVTWTAFQGNITGDSGPGRLLRLILDSNIDSRLLTAITGIVGVGSAYLAGGQLSDRIYYLVVGTSALGIGACIALYLLLGDEEIAIRIYSFGSEDLADSERFSSSVNLFLAGTGLWLAGVLGVQVGLHSGQVAAPGGSEAPPSPERPS